MIVGLSGKKGSGKSTVAEYLKSRIEGAVVISFADPLKKMTSDLFGVPMKQLIGSEDEKNLMTQSGMTGRQLMQNVGQAMREVWPHCWVNAWRSEVDSFYAHQGVSPVIVPDVRYPNEVNIIKQMGGIVIRLTRHPFADQHESENALNDSRYFDAVIDNALLTKEEANAEVINFCRKMGIV